MKLFVCPNIMFVSPNIVLRLKRERFERVLNFFRLSNLNKFYIEMIANSIWQIQQRISIDFLRKTALSRYVPLCSISIDECLGLSDRFFSSLSLIQRFSFCQLKMLKYDMI